MGMSVRRSFMKCCFLLLKAPWSSVMHIHISFDSSRSDQWSVCHDNALALASFGRPKYRNTDNIVFGSSMIAQVFAYQYIN